MLALLQLPQRDLQVHRPVWPAFEFPHRAPVPLQFPKRVPQVVAEEELGHGAIGAVERPDDPGVVRARGFAHHVELGIGGRAGEVGVEVLELAGSELGFFSLEGIRGKC